MHEPQFWTPLEYRISGQVDHSSLGHSIASHVVEILDIQSERSTGRFPDLQVEVEKKLLGKEGNMGKSE